MHVSMPPPPPLRRRVRTLACGLLLVFGLLAGSAALVAGDEPKEPPSSTEAGRKNAIKGLKSKIRRLASSPWALKKTDEILKHLEALTALGGHEAGAAALAALPATQEAVRDAAFDIVEREHDKRLVKPLAALLEDKNYRRDVDAKRRIAHALAVMDDASAVEPLAGLIRFDEDAEVVLEAADALSSYGAVPVKTRKIAVRRLVDLYESTYNIKESVRPEDKVLRKVAIGRYKIYGKALRYALQALTGERLTRPHEWRRWWNSNKKRPKWGPSRSSGR